METAVPVRSPHAFQIDGKKKIRGDRGHPAVLKDARDISPITVRNAANDGSGKTEWPVLYPVRRHAIARDSDLTDGELYYIIRTAFR